jgi:hypothetical protein
MLCALTAVENEMTDISVRIRLTTVTRFIVSPVFELNRKGLFLSSV